MTKATERCILDYHFLYKFALKVFFTPKSFQTWSIFSETQIPFSQTQDNTKQKKVKFSAGGSEANRECLVHVLDASKNDVNKF